MPYNIKKQGSDFKVCKKIGNKKCLPGKSKSKAMAQKRITAIHMNESFNQRVDSILKSLGE
jgi:hypothetical protein